MKEKVKIADKPIVVLLGGGILFVAALFMAILSPAGAQPIKPVDPDIVCMVNDTVMTKPQIPVPFEGKTYYGCCEGCVEKLQNERAVRFSRDPVTGKEVDKADAFIVASAGGEALYFESSETAQKYTDSMESKENK